MVEWLLAAEWITLQGASEAPVVKDGVLHFHLLAIEVFHYPNAYTAWRSHHHQNTDIYSGLYSTLKIRKWNRHMDQVRKNLESVWQAHQFFFSHICLTANDINVFNTCIVVFHPFFNSLMTAWMICSSTPLKKEISAFAVLIVQVGLEESTVGFVAELFSFSVCNVTGTMVSFVVAGKAPPFIDTCIVPGGAACLYALFEWGLR